MVTQYKDRITVLTGGGRDPRGNPLPMVEEGPFPANVDPVRSDESVSRGQPPLTLYYHLIVPPHVGEIMNPNSKVKWLGRQLEVQGDVEPWTLQGRIHHYECSLKVG